MRNLANKISVTQPDIYYPRSKEIEIPDFSVSWQFRFVHWRKMQQLMSLMRRILKYRDVWSLDESRHLPISSHNNPPLPM